LLEIKNLEVILNTDRGSFKAVDNVSFKINKGEILGLVGESGSGKSITALSILRLLPNLLGEIKKGEILFENKDLLKLSLQEMRKIRGKEISMIFQEPLSALSPLHIIGNQLSEAVLLHENISKHEALKISQKWLELLKIPDAHQKMSAYPFELSGGMQQRIVIAMALMLNPKLIIADEPTTALDVTVQAQIFKLIKQMKKNDTSILFITHDLGAVWEMCDRVAIMYASQIVEEGNLNNIFFDTKHPYTKALLESIPSKANLNSNNFLKTISGTVPSPFDYPTGCHFYLRCPKAFDLCKKNKPDMLEISKNHRVACFLI